MALKPMSPPPADEPAATRPGRPPFNPEGHVKAIGAIQVVLCLLMLIGGSVILFSGAFSAQEIRDNSSEEGAARLVENIMGVMGVVLLLLAAIGIAGAIGLFMHRSWGRILSFVTAAVLLLSIPFGTAFGIYSFIILGKSETAALFAGDAR